MYSILRPLLFKLDEERAHDWALNALRYVPKFCFPQAVNNPVHALGLTFSNPVGLAAGLDKNGQYLDALAKMGFSFIELGTVTPRPQMGNPLPRMFRLPQANALINRMGFNNHGVEALVANVKKAQYRGILGINIGKNKDTPLERAVEDYLFCFGKVYEYASYVTINISSPNTPDLRQLQRGEYFSDLLTRLRQEQLKLSDQWQRHVPLVVKVSPDEPQEILKEMTEVILKNGIEGVISTNTSAGRQGVDGLPFATEQGGLSGAPLLELSTACLRLLKSYLGKQVTLIGVGGIDSVAGGQAKIDAGASLVQVYTGLIYQGPGLVPSLANGLVLDKQHEC